jgi:hypothetical protein
VRTASEILGKPASATSDQIDLDKCINEIKRGREDTRRFLCLLDPGAHDFTFQTFDDNRCNGHDINGRLARSTSDRAEILQIYELGAGVYVTVNETDLTGRKSENIKRIRAIWQEDDHGHGGPFPLDPSLVVESSPGHFHRYWIVADHWPADEQGRADFAAVMERMVESYGCDHRAKDLSRVLRLPGFLHRKDPARPHMVRIVAEAGRRYDREEILRAFPPVERETRQEHSCHEWDSSDCDEERIADALRALPADDRDIWLQVGMALKDSLGERGRSLWDTWSASSSKFNQKDQERTWRSIRRSGITVATLFWHAQRNGWSPLHREKTNAVNGPEGLWSSSVVSVVPAWPQIDEAAFQGLAGEAVKAIEPHSEADPVALLMQFLTLAGNLIGRTAYYRVEDDRHHANLFAVLVGESSKARKGTSMGRVRSVAKIADQGWSDDRLKGGLSSGEGLINEVRDERREWDRKAGREEIVDPGVADKRLMIVEAEFASALAVMERAIRCRRLFGALGMATSCPR